MRKNYLIIILMLFSLSEVFSQGWEKIYTGIYAHDNSQNHGIGMCIKEASDEGLIIGATSYNVLTKDDIALVKTDPNGEIIWSKIYGGSGSDQIRSIIKIKNGYVALGSTNSFGTGNTDVYMLCFDNQGELLWSKAYGDQNNQEGYSIEQTSNGDFIITGYSTNSKTLDEGSFTDANDLLLLKTDDKGSLLWSKVFNTFNNDYGIEVHETIDGDYIVAGSSDDLQNRDRVYILKTDSDGNLLWSRIIANSFFASTGSMKITPDNNYLICTGASGSAYLLKLDESGKVLWSKKAHVNTWGNRLVITNDNAAVFTSGFGYINGGLTKIDMNGDLIWSKNYPGNKHQYISNVEQINDGSFILTGTIDTSVHYVPGHISVIKTDSEGETDCSQSIYPPVVIEPYSYVPHITLSSSLGIEMGVATNLYAGIFENSTICQPAAYFTSTKEKIKDRSLNIYPNPTSGKLNIEFSSIRETSNVCVFDITGRCVYSELINMISSHNVDLSSKEKGIYFLEVTTGKGKEVKKVILN